MSYSTTAHAQIVTSLRLVGRALQQATTAVAAGDAAITQGALEVARTEKNVAVTSFPAVVVNPETSLTFEAVYADFYQVDILIIVALQWPDTAPTAIMAMKQLLDAFTEKLDDLRRLRAEPWSDRAPAALAGLDSLIAKTAELPAALELLEPHARLDPRRFLWNGQDFKVEFLDGLGQCEGLGGLYRLLFSLDHAMDRARWSVGHGKMPGASRRIAEAVRVQGLLLDWLDEHQPTA